MKPLCPLQKSIYWIAAWFACDDGRAVFSRRDPSKPDIWLCVTGSFAAACHWGLKAFLEAEIQVSPFHSGSHPSHPFTFSTQLFHLTLRALLLLLFWVPGREFHPRNKRRRITILAFKIPNLLLLDFVQGFAPFLSLPQETSKTSPLEQWQIESRRLFFFSTSEDHWCRLKHIQYTATGYYSEWGNPIPLVKVKWIIPF